MTAASDEAPTSAPVSDEQRAAQRRELLRREIARRRAGASTATNRIVARPAGMPPVISAAQERLWLIDQMYPGQNTYNATMTMRFEGTLDVAALRDAVATVIARHEALRTVIRRDAAGRPAGTLLPADAPLTWAEQDLRADPSRLEALLTTAAATPFDLAHDPLLRGSVFRVGEDEWVLILVTHHIASDGWSRTPLFEELTEAYNAAVGGREPNLPDLPVQYGDYALWQREQHTGDRFEQTLGYWREELAGADLVLDLPTDRPRPDTRLFRGRRFAFQDDELGEQLRALGRENAATPFMTYLALTVTMLHALSGQTDFLLGSPSANRDRPETVHLIGFFVDTIIVRVPLDGDPSFTDIVQRSRRAVLRSLGHPIPLDRLVDAIRPRRIPGVNPLFQVNYRMQGAPPPTPQLDGLRSTRLFTDLGASRFDLAFGFVDEPGRLRGYFEYDEALFEEATIIAWADAVLALAGAATTDPSRTLHELAALVTARTVERRQAAIPQGPSMRRIRNRSAP